jgi:hypothetical protein
MRTTHDSVVLLKTFGRCISVVVTISACGLAQAADQTSAEPGGTVAKTTELRAVWLHARAFSDDDAQDTTRLKLKRANLNTVFLIAPQIGDNPGWSPPEAFGQFLKKLEDNRYAVHGWLLNFQRRPQPVDFSDPNEQAAQVQWAIGLLDQYAALDGVHLDFIRAAKWGASSKVLTDGVTNTVRKIHDAIGAKYPGKLLSCAGFPGSEPAYRGFRRKDGKIEWSGEVPQWLQEWYAANPDNYFTRLVASGKRKNLEPQFVCGPNFLGYQQDLVTWLRTGAIDAVVIMNYTMDDEKWRAETEVWKSFMNGKIDNLYMGLGWLVEQGQYDWGYDPKRLCGKIQWGRQNGLRGFSIFTMAHDPKQDEILIQALSEDAELNGGQAPFKTPAQSPLKARSR